MWKKYKQVSFIYWYLLFTLGWAQWNLSRFEFKFDDTVKLGDKERFDKEPIGIKEPFPVWPIVNLLHKNKEHLALRNNFS